MIKLKAGDVVDVSHWDGLTVLMLVGDYVKVDISALGDGVHDCFHVKEIDGWTDDDIGLNMSDDGMWFGVRLYADQCFYLIGNDIIEAIDSFNNGDLIISD